MMAALAAEQSTRHGAAPVKVVRIITRLIVGGPTVHVMTLNERLDPRRFASTLIVGRESPGEKSVVEWARRRGVALREVPTMVGDLSVKGRDLRTVMTLYQVMRRERPHIVHTHTAKAGAVGRVAAWLAGVPVVVHTYHGHILHGYFSPLVNAGLRAMERWLARRTDCVIAVSDRVRDDLVRYRIAGPEKIRVVPLGVELRPFLTAAGMRGEFRREINAGAERRLVGIVGRVAAIKNHELFLRALGRVAVANDRIVGIVVGDGPRLNETRALAGALGLADRVAFTGWRMDLPRIYADLDVLVVCSRNEGTPVSIIEAMAAGCPVVATSVGGIPDMITDGETGRLVPAGDEAALAQAIVQTLEDGERSRVMAQRARDRALAHYGAQRLVRDVECLYGDLLARGSRARTPAVPRISGNARTGR